MNYILSNPEIDNQISTIRKMIRLSMNGAVSEAMKSHGLVYKQNFGVTIPRLKEIAIKFEKKHDLAQRLWHLNIRETMILATLLQPTDSFTEVLAEKWLEQITNTELIEQANINLYQHLAYAAPFVGSCLQSDEMYQQAFGFTLAMRISGSLSHEEIQHVLDRALTTAENKEPVLIHAIASCLSRFCRKDKSTASAVLSRIHTFRKSHSLQQQFIFKSVQEEMIFLGYLPETNTR